MRRQLFNHLLWSVFQSSHILHITIYNSFLSLHEVGTLLHTLYYQLLAIISLSSNKNNLFLIHSKVGLFPGILAKNCSSTAIYFFRALAIQGLIADLRWWAPFSESNYLLSLISDAYIKALSKLDPTLVPDY